MCTNLWLILLAPNSTYSLDETIFNSQENSTRPTWSPARADRDTALALAFPESFPAFPPA